MFVLYNYDLWKIVKMEINHRSGDREKKKTVNRMYLGNKSCPLAKCYTLVIFCYMLTICYTCYLFNILCIHTCTNVCERRK